MTVPDSRLWTDTDRELVARTKYEAEWLPEREPAWLDLPEEDRNEQRQVAEAVLDAAAPLIAARVRDELAELLRTVAAGRREYASRGVDLKHERTVGEPLEAEARLWETAARLVEGDTKPLFDLLPSWRWTPEMHATVVGHLGRTAAAIERELARTFPEVADGEVPGV